MAGMGGMGGSIGGSGVSPTMIAGAVGGILNSIAAAKEQKAMFEEYQKELKRQGVYQQQATDVLNTNIAATGAGGYDSAMQKGVGKREDLYGSMQEVPLSLMQTPENAGYAARDAAYYDQAGGVRAALGGYQDAGHATDLSNLNANRGLAQIGNFAQGTAGVFPYRMYDAQNSAWKLALAGAALSAVGGMGTDISGAYGKYSPTMLGASGGGGGDGPYPVIGGGVGLYGLGAAPEGTYYNPKTNQSVYSPYGDPYGIYGGG